MLPVPGIVSGPTSPGSDAAQPARRALLEARMSRTSVFRAYEPAKGVQQDGRQTHSRGRFCPSAWPAYLHRRRIRRCSKSSRRSIWIVASASSPLGRRVPAWCPLLRRQHRSGHYPLQSPEHVLQRTCARTSYHPGTRHGLKGLLLHGRTRYISEPKASAAPPEQSARSSTIPFNSGPRIVRDGGGGGPGQHDSMHATVLEAVQRSKAQHAAARSSVRLTARLKQSPVGAQTGRVVIMAQDATALAPELSTYRGERRSA